ncbi:MAG: MFS transporter [Acidobacteriota bacterium]|jgi:sugar phosphate permease|nr:MFS transporter [Acidobacteriota bacterium]
MSKPRLFYGWWVLLGIFLGYTALVGIQVYTLPLFYPELKSEFGWSAESITLAATIFYLTGACLTPIVSPLFDRYSAKAFMIAGALITVLGLFAYRWMESLLQLTIIYMVLALSQVCAGQVPTILIITRWFKRYRGIAVGITLIGTSVGGALFPLVFRQAMDAGGWRDAVTVFMVLGGMMMLIPYIFVIRSRPEDKGLFPDGDAARLEAAGLPTKPKPHGGPTLGEALHNPAFYILAFATGALWFTMNGVYNNQSFFMSGELGLSRNDYTLIFSAIFWFAIAGKLLFGYLSDRCDKILLMFFVVVLLIIGLVFLRLSRADNLISLYGYAAVFGLGFGGTFTMIQLVIAEFFEGRSFARILGLLTAVDVACGGIAITLLARMRTAFGGSYLPVIELLIGLTCLNALMVLFLFWKRRRFAGVPASVLPEAG